jgi:hypothetical protein
LSCWRERTFLKVSGQQNLSIQTEHIMTNDTNDRGTNDRGTGLLLGKALPLGIGDVYPPLCANPVGWHLGRMIRRSR